MIEAVNLWHKRARPEPTVKDFSVQLGCHFEEIVEMMDTLKIPNAAGTLCEARDTLFLLATWLKKGIVGAQIADREMLLDSIADQIVTSVGVAHCAGMNAAGALERVNTSNWSKFDENGEPLRDESGKIKKGPNYKPPVLDGLY